MAGTKPLIGITSDSILMRNIMPGAGVYEVYTRAVNNAAGGLPWIIPPLGAELDLDAVVERLDGIVFTGARSNIEPHHYGGSPAAPDSPRDPARDSTTLPLIKKVLERQVPALCICRGMQELNVALGGTLHQEIHKLPERDDHRAAKGLTPDQKFAPAHDVEILSGGALSRLVHESHFRVNSMHEQGIDRLADGLRVEARADDGTIEAVSVKDSPVFAVGVQWHPEWEFRQHPLYAALWQAFGEACRERVRSRGREE
ncbi:MAG: gamma-glutamyl-gamma-aminobutyrate hydrolase family protein [Gammaproteobacteria bacterium]|nr:gamma-glutamyl-gamma-aminobutyrate hydrolase family protein [Gammaproteobacteria bacterium]